MDKEDVEKVEGMTGSLIILHFRKGTEQLDMRFKSSKIMARRMYDRRVHSLQDCPPNTIYFLNDKWMVNI